VASVATTLLEWNVHYTNHNLRGIADIIRKTQPDIVGLCEFTASPDSMAEVLSQELRRSFQVQPGRGRWHGYGTDIFFDNGKWEPLEGGVERVVRCASRGGPRAANWLVLRDRQTGKKLITGGMHTSYCAGGCDGLHECELGVLYTKFDAMKSWHGEDTAVIWMGDTNRNIHTRIMQNLLRGRLGWRQIFPVDDVAQTQGNTYYTGGLPIDFIVGETGHFRRKAGGRTGQGTTGRHLNGADHFPIYADVDLL
jgi:endonuclease/exonuclease/phosphatase family metal-dependent hydrolase